MIWKKYPRMKDVIAEIPSNNGIQYSDYAIPDVYGKMLQLYFALYDSNEQRRYRTSEVNLWRGLITIIALQQHLRLPLSWEKVIVPKSSLGEARNILDIALQRPPQEPERMLFPQQEAQWNGDEFYVLKWTDKNEQEIDLLLYSPFTLVYPVADWRSIFGLFEEIKWFDRDQQLFSRPENKLSTHEKRIVYYWLEKTHEHFNNSMNEAQRTIEQQLSRFKEDLKITLNSEDRSQRFRLTEIGSTDAGPEELFTCLRNTVTAVLPVTDEFQDTPFCSNDLFSDQICYIQAEKNPFANCLYADSYKIKSHPNWYAFLPVNPALRNILTQQNQDIKIDMQWQDGPGGEHIHVTLLLCGEKYDNDYRVSTTSTSQKYTAVPYTKNQTDEKSMPLVAVWPNKIGQAWKKHYVMIDGSGCDSGYLKIVDQNEVTCGSNPYVVLTNYAPTVIPIAKKLRNNEGEVSVGMITPKLDTPRINPALISADVAIDFGTSSTQVFARIDQGDEPINIAEDEPLLVIDYKDDTHDENIQNQYMMRDYFIPPHDYARGASSTLFSVYRRIGNLMHTVNPVLDGVIYQPGAVDIVDIAENSKGCLMQNLKWDVRNSRAYYVAFMKQLFLHIVVLLYARGVTSITWKYALPENMDEPSKDEVRKIWGEELKKYLDEIAEGIHCEINSDLTESEAASRYFLFSRDRPVHAGKGYLVVDIGGGSTDTALWQGEGRSAHMKWHSSINTAGRKMFTRWIANSLRELCSALPDEKIGAETELILNMESATQSTLVEMMLHAHYNKLLTHYRQECRNNSDTWGMELCAHITKAISMLLFALGYQIGIFLSKEKFKIPDGLGEFVIAFGGRGSNMLGWCNCDYGPLKEMFCEGVKAGGGRLLPDEVRIEVSLFPKIEVAKGLLIRRSCEEQSPLDPVDITMTAEKYVDAVEKFQAAFKKIFRAGQDGTPPAFMQQNVDPNVLAAQIEHHVGDKNRIVNVFMETIYDGLAE